MRLYRPKSIRRLLLTGFALVVVPLLLLAWIVWQALSDDPDHPDALETLFALPKDFRLDRFFEGEEPVVVRFDGEAAQAVVDRIKELEREVRELRQANEILKKASAYFAAAELDRPFRK